MITIKPEEINENMSKVAKSAYDLTKTFYTISSSAAEQLFEQQVAMATLGMKSVASQLELAGTAKNYQTAVADQADIADMISSTSQGITRNTLDILNESREDVSMWFEKVAKEAADNSPIMKAA